MSVLALDIGSSSVRAQRFDERGEPDDELRQELYDTTVPHEIEPMCHDDHDLHTRHGWALVDGTGTRPMVPPDDPRHPKNTRPPP